MNKIIINIDGKKAWSENLKKKMCITHLRHLRSGFHEVQHFEQKISVWHLNLKYITVFSDT